MKNGSNGSHASPRRMGWMAYPILCPQCGRRVREHAIVTHGGAVRCDRGCNVLLYVVPALQHNAAFVIQLSAAEAHDIRNGALSMMQALDVLGARFPTAK